MKTMPYGSKYHQVLAPDFNNGDYTCFTGSIDQCEKFIQYCLEAGYKNRKDLVNARKNDLKIRGNLNVIT